MARSAVVAGDEGVEAEAAVLAEGDFAEQEVAEDVGGEEVLFVLPGFVGEAAAGNCRLRCRRLQGAEGVEDGFGADYVAAGLRHLRFFEEEPAVGGDGFGQRQAGGEQECGPVDAVEADDLFADEVEVGGPVLFELGLLGGVVAAVADGGHVVGEGVEPDVDDVFFVAGDGDAPFEAGCGRWRGL